MNENKGDNNDIIDLLSKGKINQANKLLTEMTLKTKEDEKNIIRFQYNSKPRPYPHYLGNMNMKLNKPNN
jgi:hypothetical protein